MESSHLGQEGLEHTGTWPPANTRTDVLGRRASAAIIDLLVLGLFFVGLVVVTHGAHTQTVSGPGGYPVTSHVANLSGGTVLVFFALSLSYYFVLESAIGQTIGKMLLGLQVVGLDGRAASTGQILVRTLGRLIDALPLLYLVGIISLIAGHSPRKRVGDRLAGTTVAPV